MSSWADKLFLPVFLSALLWVRHIVNTSTPVRIGMVQSSSSLQFDTSTRFSFACSIYAYRNLRYGCQSRSTYFILIIIISANMMFRDYVYPWLNLTCTAMPEAELSGSGSVEQAASSRGFWRRLNRLESLYVYAVVVVGSAVPVAG